MSSSSTSSDDLRVSPTWERTLTVLRLLVTFPKVVSSLHLLHQSRRMTTMIKTTRARTSCPRPPPRDPRLGLPASSSHAHKPLDSRSTSKQTHLRRTMFRLSRFIANRRRDASGRERTKTRKAKRTTSQSRSLQRTPMIARTRRSPLSISELSGRREMRMRTSW